MYKIYTLSDPFTNKIRWVGSTKYPLWSRLAKHCNSTDINRQRNEAKYLWIMDLRAKGVRPVIELLEECETLESALQLETYWTYQFENWGFPLFNLQYGKNKGRAAIEKSREWGRRNPLVRILHLKATEARRRPVYQLSLSGDVIELFDKITDAASKLGIDRGDITKCCKSNNKTAGGYRWMYCPKH